jgi:hypothetical protein
MSLKAFTQCHHFIDKCIFEIVYVNLQPSSTHNALYNGATWKLLFTQVWISRLDYDCVQKLINIQLKLIFDISIMENLSHFNELSDTA